MAQTTLNFNQVTLYLYELWIVFLEHLLQMLNVRFKKNI